MRQNRPKPILVRTAALLLLFLVAALSVAVKHAKYLPKSNPVDILRFAKAAKMEWVNHSLDFAPKSLHATFKVAPPEPELSATPLLQSQSIALFQFALEAPFQHRAPPCPLA